MKAKVQTPKKTPQKVQTPKKTPLKVQTPKKTPLKVQTPKKHTPQKVQTPNNRVVPSEYKEVKVSMPRIPNVADVLKDLLEYCETIRIYYHGSAVILGLAPDKADEIVKKLSALSYDGQKLYIDALYDRPIETLIKRISLPRKNYEEKLKVHFNATKVECHKSFVPSIRKLYMLHFSTKSAADKAMKKSIEIAGKEMYPLDCYIRKTAEKRNGSQKGRAAKKLKTNNNAKSVEEEEDDDEDDAEEEEEEDDDEDAEEEEDDDDDDEEEDDDDDDE